MFSLTQNAPIQRQLRLGEKVDLHERRERNKILRILSDKKRNEFYTQMMGKKLDVLFEHENNDGLMKGFSSNYVRVSHPFDANFANNILPVKITGMSNAICTGEIMDTKKSVDLIAC